MQVVFVFDVQVDQVVVGDLVYYVVKEGNFGIELGFVGFIQVDGDFDLGFQGVVCDGCFVFGYYQFYS